MIDFWAGQARRTSAPALGLDRLSRLRQLRWTFRQLTRISSSGGAHDRCPSRAAAPLAPAELQTFARENDRARLSPVAIKAFLALSKAWGLSNAEAAALIGVSASSLDRIKRGYRPTLSQDQLTRVSALIGVFKGLHLLFADATADEWVRRTNSGPLFDRQTPIEAMIEGGIPRMLDVRRYDRRRARRSVRPA